MKKYKGVVIALAAAILTSGGGVAGSVVMATPAQAAEQVTNFAPNAPTGLKYANAPMPYSPYFTPTIMVGWNAPTGVLGTITDYTITLKQTGKTDRVINSKTTYASIGSLTENTAYTIQVKANVVSKTGVKQPLPQLILQFAPTTLTTHRELCK